MSRHSNPQLTDSRRLTGANLYWDLPAAIIDAQVQGEPGPLIAAWSRFARTLLEGLERAGEKLTHRVYRGGVSLLISSPVDVLYSMCELNEAAFYAALAESGTGYEAGETVDLEPEITRLASLFDKENNPALLELRAAARQHDVPFLWDDDQVSAGYGKTALVWTPQDLPSPADVDWSKLKSIPVALVTGTNGKTTTVRMAASIIATTGLRAGLTSTDWIRIGETILDSGDYSGTGGARMVMRHPDTELAVLETARGGLLRRGLGVDKVTTALITNVAADHLGDYGIDTIAELTEAKFIVRRALQGDAPLILNADDNGIVAFAATLDCTIIWFSLNPANPVIMKHLEEGGRAALLKEGMLELTRGSQARQIIAAGKIPATMGGVARHNLLNALGAMALCSELGASDTAIHDGLASFMGDETDNPGRGNWFEKGGVKILVDFAHNEHGMLALAEMVSNVPAKRRLLLMGQAGDRLDGEIVDMTRAACRIRPEFIVACALPGFERGRPQSEVQKLILDTAIKSGIPAQKTALSDSPAEAAATVLAHAQAGDLLVLLTLTQRQEVLRLVHTFVDG